MGPVALFLLAIAAIFLIGALGEIIFQRTNVPDVIWLIVAGILLGESVTGVVSRAQLDVIAPYFAALTLVVVLFDGGSALRLGDLSRAAPRSSLLAVLTFLLSALALACVSMLAARFGFLPETWSWSHGLLLGAILGGSSSIIIMPAMVQARVEPRVANLVSLESALTDAFCVVGTAAIIDIMLSGRSGAAAPVASLVSSFGIGLGLGAMAGILWLLFLQVLHSSEHSYPVTLAGLLILYVVIDRSGGSAALGILTFAVIVGNADLVSQRIGMRDRVELDVSLRGFHKQMTFMVKSFFFVFIGAMLGPPMEHIALGVLLGAVLFGARIPGVFLATVGSRLSAPQRKLVAVSMPRGMAAGVLATLPVSAGVPGTEALPVIVFACVFTTILVFAGGFPLLRRRTEPTAGEGSFVTAVITSVSEGVPRAARRPGPAAVPPADLPAEDAPAPPEHDEPAGQGAEPSAAEDAPASPERDEPAGG